MCVGEVTPRKAATGTYDSSRLPGKRGREVEGRGEVVKSIFDV